MIGALLLALLIIIPFVAKAARSGTPPVVGSADIDPRLAAPPLATVDCPACGQRNRLPIDAEQALCGKCKASLLSSSFDPPGEVARG